MASAMEFENKNAAYSDPRHPISYVCRRVGLSTYVVRAWEKRYGAVVPARTSTKRRLYSDAEIDRLDLLARLVAQGHSISQIARLERERLEEILRATVLGSNDLRNAKRGDNSNEFLQRSQRAVSRGDGDALSNDLTDAAVRLSQPVLLAEVVGPLLCWIGDEWHKGEIRIANEHLATTVLRDFLGDLRRKHHPQPGMPTIVVATPSGEPHEFGALMVTLSTASDGWRDVYLGPNTPWQEIADVVIENDARAVALSLSYPGDNPEIQYELEKLRRYLPESVPIFVGGAGAVNRRRTLEELGLRCVETWDEYQAGLVALLL